MNSNSRKTEINVNNYTNDFLTIIRARQLVKEDMLSSIDKPGYEIRPLPGATDGAMWRCTYPQGKQALREFWQNSSNTEDTNPWFVGFFGFKWPNIEDSVAKQIWELDSQLIEDLPCLDHVMCYSSIQQTPGGEWMNFVLLKSEQGLTQWLSRQNHKEASKILSPYYFSQVRIHIGELVGGVESSSFMLHRTTFLDYSKWETGEPGEGFRHIHLWNRTTWNDVQ